MEACAVSAQRRRWSQTDPALRISASKAAGAGMVVVLDVRALFDMNWKACIA